MTVGCIATLATSQVRGEVESTVDGSLQLRPDAPIAATTFTFEANAAALGGGNESLWLEWDTYWSGVPSGISPELIPELVAISDTASADRWVGSDPGIRECLDGCVGTHRMTFRWPSGLEAGAVRVQWELQGVISYESAHPPDGASIDVRASQPSATEVPVRVFDEQIDLDREQPVVMRTLRLRSEAAIPEGAILAVELGEVDTGVGQPGVDQGSVSVTLVEQGGSHRLRPATSTQLELPDECREGPCSFSISLVAELQVVAGSAYAFVGSEWGVTSLGAAVVVTPEEHGIPIVSDRVAIGRVRLVAESGIHGYRFTISLPATALPRAEFGHLEPVIQARLSFNAVQESLDLDDGLLYLRYSFPSAPSAVIPSFEDTTFQANLDSDDGFPEYPATFVVPNDCEPEAPCEVELVIEFWTSGQAGSFDEPFDGLVELDSTLDVTVAYPITGAVPADASVDVVAEVDV